jgi:hypothetical protein
VTKKKKVLYNIDNSKIHFRLITPSTAATFPVTSFRFFPGSADVREEHIARFAEHQSLQSMTKMVHNYLYKFGHT